jgi:hypothetical protein
MNGSNQNTFGMPRKIVTESERLRTESGQVVELRHVETIVYENGVIKKDTYMELVPPLSDNRMPESVSDITECCVCLQLYHRDSCEVCPGCKRTYCRRPGCRGKAEDEQGIEVDCCSLCAEAANKHIIIKFWDKLWNIGD